MMIMLKKSIMDEETEKRSETTQDMAEKETFSRKI